MHKLVTFVLTAAVATFGVPLLAASTQCTHGDLVRSVEVIYSDPGQAVPCEVLYEKSTEGQQLTPWRAQNDHGFCETKAASLVEKLQSMGWACGTARQAGRPVAVAD